MNLRALCIGFLLAAPALVQCKRELLPIEAVYAVPGPSQVSRSTVFDGAHTALYELYYPSEIGRNGFHHPLLVWGNGTGGTVAQYGKLLTQMASWGFVVIASTSSSTGTGREMLDSLDWLVASNADPTSAFFGALDLAKIGVFGHSQGAAGSMRTFTLANAKGSPHRAIATLVPIELPSQKWICAGNTDPSCPSQEWVGGESLRSGSVFFVNGSRDFVISPSTQDRETQGEQSIAAYYQAVPEATPKAKATLIDADHNDIQDVCQHLCGGAGQAAYFGYLVAWMRYRLFDDRVAQLVFVSGNEVAELLQNAAWTNQAEHGLFP